LGERVSFGIQSTIQVGDNLFTIETETRVAADQPLIDTTVYAYGRVLYRRVKSYQDLLEGPAQPEVESLRNRIELQHRGVAEDLRSGALKFDLPSLYVPQPQSVSRGTIEFPAGIEVRLLNAASWLRSGTASLEVEVRGRATLLPAAGAKVEVFFESAEQTMRLQGGTDSRGRVSLVFPLPKAGIEGGQLVIRACGPFGQDELRYRVKPKPARLSTVASG
jgi:hypothetical protein